MVNVFKPIAFSLAVFAATPVVNAEKTEPITVAFKYNPDAPVSEIYKRAKRTAQRACELSGSLRSVKRMQTRICTEPLLAEFVIKTGNPDLKAYYEARNGVSATDIKLASK